VVSANNKFPTLYIHRVITGKGANAIKGHLSSKQIDMRHITRLPVTKIKSVELLAQGYSKKEVAEKLGLSYHTIVCYVRTIYEKLESPNLGSAIAKAIRQNII